jgi:hypothetical protein
MFHDNLFALVSISPFLRGVVFCIQGREPRDLQEKETAAVVFLQKTSTFLQ